MAASGSRRARQVTAAVLLAWSGAAQTASAEPDASAILAAARTAAGGWRDLGLLTLRGTVVAGDAPSRVVETIDPRSDRYRTDTLSGASSSQDGFDGRAWTSANGVVTVIDLPAAAADIRGRAFLLRQGWLDPAIAGAAQIAPACDAGAECVLLTANGGDMVTIAFDRRTHLPLKAVMSADYGPESTTYADWRAYRGAMLAHRMVITGADGSTTTATVEGVGRAARSGLARPASRPHGSLAGGAPATVPLRYVSDYGHLVVPATIEGQAVDLLFDTGGANYLAPASARRLNLQVGGGVNLGGVGEGSEGGGFAQVSMMAIGGARLSDQAVIVGPLPYPALRPRRGLVIAGLTGFEFLSEFRTTVDYARRTLTFGAFGRPMPPGGVTVPFRSDGHDIYVGAAVNGAAGAFLLDTGDAGTLTVFRRWADAHGLFPGQGGGISVGAGVGGTFNARKDNARAFTLGGVTLSDVPVEVSDTKAGAFASRTIAGNLGAGVLSRFTITIDYRARTVTFRPNDRVSAPFGHDRTGLSVDQVGPETMRVLAIAPDSPGARAGVLAGDEIVAVDGRPVAADRLGIFDLQPLRYGSKPFSLTLPRKGALSTVTITPGDL